MCNCGKNRATAAKWEVKLPDGTVKQAGSQAAAIIAASKIAGAVAQKAAT